MTPETEKENPIVVAMSGGVDSSVAAALMKKKASNVLGVTLKLYDEKKVKNSKTCCAGIDILDAKKLQIQFLFLIMYLIFKRYLKKVLLILSLMTIKREEHPYHASIVTKKLNFLICWSLQKN